MAETAIAGSEFASGATGLMTAITQASASKAQAQYQSQMAELNAKGSDLQSRDALSRGSQTANKYRKDAQRLISSQRAKNAAGGVDINSGSAADQVDVAEAEISNNIQMIKSNAWRESWGYKTEARNQRAGGQMSRAAGDTLSRNTLLTGGLNFLNHGSKASQYYYGKSKSGSENDEFNDPSNWGG